MKLWQLVSDSFLMAWQALRTHRLRSFLSVLGITIGIFAIIIVFTVVDSLEFKLRGSVQEIGNNVVFVQKWPWSFKSDYPWWKYINRPLPGYREMDELKKRLSTASYLAYCAEFNAKTIK